MTAAKFIQDPPWLLAGARGSPGRRGRVYKSGDLVRYKEDGSLVFIGRKDTQVKIRGHRVELAEIEQHVQRCIPRATGVVAEMVQLGRGVSVSPALVAFIQSKADARRMDEAEISMIPIQGDLEAKLRQRLPSYMLPVMLISMAKLPISNVGKADRRRLRELVTGMSEQDLAAASVNRPLPARQPSSEAERILQAIWSQVLKLEPETIGIDDGFLRLGGDSILAMQAACAARAKCISIRTLDILNHKTIASIVTHLPPSNAILKAPPTAAETGQIPTAAGAVAAKAGILNQPGVIAATEQSFAQERLWYLDRLYPGIIWYLVPYSIQLRGQLHLGALQTAIHALERRHESFRTTFASVDGVNLQIVHAFQGQSLKIVDISAVADEEAQTLLRVDQTRPFNLETEPSWRVTLYRRAADDHVLSLTIHHILHDGWSVDILQRELADFYSLAVRGEDPLANMQPLPLQYREYSDLERQPSQIAKHQTQLKYWVAQLESSRPAEFLYDKPRPAELSGQADVQRFHITGSLYERLHRFCLKMGVTPHVVLLSAFRATHFRLAGAEDATLGAVYANRDAWQVENVIGFFVNMQCIRTKISDRTTFADLVRQANETVAAAMANSDVPFGTIVSKLRVARHLSRNPLVQLAFGYDSQPGLAGLTLQDLDAQRLPTLRASQFDVEFHFYRQENALMGEVIFSTDLFTAKTMANMISTFRMVLQQSLETPALAIQTLPLLGHDNVALLEEMGVLEMHRTDYPRDSSVADVFRQQARLTPDVTAVVDSSLVLTYAQLDRLSDVLCSWLVNRCFVPETLVGVLAGRACYTIVAFVAVLKANLAYLPLDGKLPIGRMETILSSVQGQKLVLVGGQEVRASVLKDAELVRIEDILRENAAAAKEYTTSFLDAPRANSNSLAYVMFTSGSTGKPKGVMIQHGNILHASKKSTFVDSLPAAPIMAHISSISFDMSTGEVYPTILNGGTLVCVGDCDLVEHQVVASIFTRHNVNSLFITPALLRQYLKNCPMIFGAIQTVCVGADIVRPDDLQRLKAMMKCGRILNAYGPTENTCVSTIHVVPEDGGFPDSVPIGHAVSNSGAYVTDTLQQLVAVGVVGELVVTGDGLARGYLDPRQDMNKFITMTIRGKKLRAYRTGDFVRRRPVDGQLEYLGRLDGQVKVRGHRVELGEIEQVMRSHCLVGEAVAAIQRDMVVGFVTLQDDDEEESRLVELWGDSFDASKYAEAGAIKMHKIGRHFLGWTSMYDGQDIDEVEMNEWLDDTIQTVLNGKHARHVLEVGTGSGMILFNLGPGLESYSGIELSGQAIEYVANTVKSMPELDGKVHMFQGAATDVKDIKLPFPPNLVVINSVAQYFPSQGYLLRVIRDLCNLAGVETIVIGDVRSHALYQEFCVTKLLHSAMEDLDKEDFQSAMALAMAAAVPELLIDPAFFTQLRQLLPHVVEHIEILPKMMNATNELSCYRYAAVIHIKQGSAEAPMGRVKEVHQEAWIDFEQQGMDRESLSMLLKNTNAAGPDDTVIAVGNIPNSKVTLERQILDSLYRQPPEPEPGPGVSGGRWLSTMRKAAHEMRSLSAVDLVEIANKAGYRVEVSWARQFSLRGSLDAVFHRRGSVHAVVADNRSEVARVLFSFPNDNDRRPSVSLSSHPLQRQIRDKVQRELQSMLRAKLPTYMVPRRVTVLEAMPLDDRGKIDRRALGSRLAANETRPSHMRQVSSDMERKLQQIWGQVLNINPATISADDSFFQLGGDSITAMQVSATARAQNLDIATVDVVQNVVLHQLAAAVTVMDPKSTPDLYLDVGDAPAEQDDGGPFPLSPIQSLHMYLEPDPTTCFDQSLMLKLRERVALSALARAMEDVVSAHPMLRARFSRDDCGQWQQHISDDVFGSFYLCKEVGIAGGKDKQGEAGSMRRCRERLNIETGPMVGCVMFDGDEFQSFFITAHHLVVDLVSWRIILEDLQDSLTRQKDVNLQVARSIAPPSMSYRSWCLQQIRHVQEDMTHQYATPPDDHADLLDVSYWGVDAEANTRQAEKSTSFVLGDGYTSKLLGTCNDVLGTRPVEIMIASLVHSFSAVFSDRAPPAVFNEGHGREPCNNQLDLSRTVGWFTTIWPAAKIHTLATDLLDAIRLTKDHMRSQPKNDWSCFSSRFADATKVSANAAMFPVEVMFNYVGLWHQVHRSDSFFSFIPPPDGCDPASLGGSRRPSIFQIRVEWEDGCLRCHFRYPDKIRHRDRILAWIEQYRLTLEQITRLSQTLSERE